MPLLPRLEMDKRTLVPCHIQLPAFSIYSGQVLLAKARVCCTSLVQLVPVSSQGRVLVQPCMFTAPSPLPKLHLLERESAQSLPAKINMNLQRISTRIHSLKTVLQQAKLVYY